MMSTPSHIPTEGLPTVDFTVAQEQTQNYRNFIADKGFDEIAFYIRIEDIFGALQLPMPLQFPPNYSISGIRVYMALEDFAGGQTHSHLYVVATDLKLNDITADTQGNSAIYDMTRPCPDLCSTPDILNGGNTQRK